MRSKNDMKNLGIFPSIEPILRKELRVSKQQLNEPIGAAPVRGCTLYQKTGLRLLKARSDRSLASPVVVLGFSQVGCYRGIAKRFMHRSSWLLFSFEYFMVSHAFFPLVDV